MGLSQSSSKRFKIYFYGVNFVFGKMIELGINKNKNDQKGLPLFADDQDGEEYDLVVRDRLKKMPKSKQSKRKKGTQNRQKRTKMHKNKREEPEERDLALQMLGLNPLNEMKENLNFSKKFDRFFEIYMQGIILHGFYNLFYSLVFDRFLGEFNSISTKQKIDLVIILTNFVSSTLMAASVWLILSLLASICSRRGPNTVQGSFPIIQAVKLKLLNIWRIMTVFRSFHTY